MNELTRMPEVGDRHGQWVWDGERWVCEDHDVGRPHPPAMPWPPFVYPSPPMQPPWYPGANAGVSFGQTAPPNPIRGHFWWDGTVLWLFDGAQWDDVGVSGAASGGTGGTSTGPNPPTNPADGALWFNGTVLFIWDGKAWVPVSQTKVYVQANAPTSPNPGDQWWNGSQLRIWDGSAWQIVNIAGAPPTGTITGVTDGSSAGAGIVGEYISSKSTFTFTAGSAQYPLILGPVPAGDWDVQCTFGQMLDANDQGTWVGGVWAQLMPYPTGLATGYEWLPWMITTPPYGTDQTLTMVGPRVRANFTTNTLFPFELMLNTDSPANGGGGTMTGLLTARRMR